MTTLVESTVPIEIPKLPSGSVKDFIPYLTKNPNTPIEQLLEPYKAFEGELRKVYAQQPKHEVLQNGAINLVSIFNGHEKEVTVRARSLATETDEEKSKYLMPLSQEERKTHGAPAIVTSLKDFQQNFNIFSESSLADLDWNNVVVAGSACTTSLLPVPEKWAESKRKLREYYHEHLAPASDVDIFLYGLNEDQALLKIKQIERNIKDSILSEVTTVRTKNAITIVSQHPIRHVQVVLRLYSSIDEILTGFDVDCSCAAYDGKQVYAAPRALAAFMTQCNTIDLTRRSPSYENRLSKYSHRGFEIHWPLLDRTRIDPTIFERSFGRTVGLARLLILEKLPKSQDRESYSDQRRIERGRPAIPRGYRNQYGGMSGNIKDSEEDEVAEWVDQEEVSSYHSMTVPYGPKYNAAHINRLLYAKDLLLNAEWNVQKDRDVYLHRHPCFFGTAEEVLEDCCGYCPVPKTDEEIKIADEESKTMVFGPLKFMITNPGAQMIGSFNPITDDEWTSMSYVGDTARLCQAIVDRDLEHVEDWCSQEGVDINRRDYTGRTPLHLAVMVSSVEVVKCLVDHGARLIARLVDGRTAIHIASARGDVEMIKILMNRSLANEEEEDKKEEVRREQRKAEKAALDGHGEVDGVTADGSKEIDEQDGDEEDDESSEASEISLNSEEGSDSMTMGSFVRLDNKENKAQEDAVLEDSSEDPDVYEIDIIAWDFGLSSLHYAILHGHEKVIDLLVSEYGADVLLPVKLVVPGTTTPCGAIMTILLTLALPTDKAKVVARQLLGLGATSAQGDQNSITVFHHVVSKNNIVVLDELLEHDRPAAMSVLNSVGSDGDSYNSTVSAPLSTAINKGHTDMVPKLLEIGAATTINYDKWVKNYLQTNEWAKSQDAKVIKERHDDSVDQPIILAAGKGLARIVEQLLEHNADPNTLEKSAHYIIRNSSSNSYQVPESLLDIIRNKLNTLREYKEAAVTTEPETLEEESFYTCSFQSGTYQYFTALKDYQHQKRDNQKRWDDYNKRLQEKTDDGEKEKKEAIAKLVQELEHTEKALIKAGAKSFVELYPQVPKHQAQNYHHNTYTPPPVPPYETNITFRTPDLNNNTRQGYTDLFEAAWEGNLEKIKSLTLAQWETKKTGLQAPLKIAIEDRNGFTPFSIAVLQGNYDLAKKIVEICAAQYHKEDGLSSRKRWTLKQTSDNGDDEEDSDYDSDREVHNHLPIFAELVSEQFTIDNLGEVATLVKSDILPLTMINATCYPNRILATTPDIETGTSSLLMYAVKTDNADLFKFILQLGAEQQALIAEDEDDQKCFSIEDGIFQEALSRGRVAMLAEMVKASGVGIPLNDLIKKSGIELKSKPKFYQGLSVGGKKRADWAQAPGTTTYVVEQTTPPLLQSARWGNIDSVEWFMSNAPMRRYKEFAEANEHDKRIKTLQSGKGFEKTISTWLGAQSELILHCAILHYHEEKDSAKYIDLLKHIISVVPESLERKSSEGWTPLQVAVFAQQKDAVSYLISIGASQRSRDKMGRNMVHSIVVSKSSSTRTRREDVESLFKLFDKKAVKEMLVERCTIHPGALTPLGLWMFINNGNCKNSSVLEVLAEYSDGEDLEMINGEGDLPLHVAVRQNLSTISSYLLSLKPSLLYRENATGRTPLEMARDSYTTSQVNTPFSVCHLSYWNRYNPGNDSNSIARKAASDFIKKDVVEETQKRTWEICNEIDEKTSEPEKKRRLVSLFEANEVAKRVAARGVRQRSGYVINGGLVDGDVKTDIVSEWLN